MNNSHPFASTIAFDEDGRLSHNSRRSIVSPHEVTSVGLVRLCGKDAKRIQLMQQFFKCRQEFYKHHLTRGYQWIDGSFVEMRRTPKDIDVVTWLAMDRFECQTALKNILRDPPWNEHDIDHYILFRDDPIKKVLYWHDLWSHTKEDIRKGYLQLDLSPEGDAQAVEMLRKLADAKGTS